MQAPEPKVAAGLRSDLRRRCRAVMRSTVLLTAMLAIAGCATRAPAPVVQRPPPPEASRAPVRTPAPPPVAQVDASSATAPATGRESRAATVPAGRPDTHVVRKGDTLVSIALEYGLDHRELAAWNRLDNINLIRIGQVLQLRAPGDAAAVARTGPLPGPAVVPRAVPLDDPAAVRSEPRAVRQPFSEKAHAEALAAARRSGALAKADAAPAPAPAPAAESVPSPKVHPATDPAALVWAWPARGPVIERFSDTNRGIDIGGKAGQPILASADGRVVYSGSAIRGYGRMLIVKHSDEYVSVYAHASELLVKEGQAVSRGQRIAEMGSTDADRVKLHFEIRRMGRPIDPLRYLPPEGAS